MTIFKNKINTNKKIYYIKFTIFHFKFTLLAFLYEKLTIKLLQLIYFNICFSIDTIANPLI